MEWLLRHRQTKGAETDRRFLMMIGSQSFTLPIVSLHPLISEAIIDDLAGRKCAASLNIPVRGTHGIVLAAKQRGVIPKACPVIEDMMAAGLYLSQKILDAALIKVGE